MTVGGLRTSSLDVSPPLFDASALLCPSRRTLPYGPTVTILATEGTP